MIAQPVHGFAQQLLGQRDLDIALQRFVHLGRRALAPGNGGVEGVGGQKRLEFAAAILLRRESSVAAFAKLTLLVGETPLGGADLVQIAFAPLRAQSLDR